MTTRHDPFAPTLPPPPPTLLIWLLIAVYLLAGLTGHDPWRGDDARHFGPILGMVRDGHWLVPHLAGDPFLDFGPLYYWVGASLTTILGIVLPLHDAARLASGLLAAMAIALTADATRRLHGDRAHAPALLLIIATLGLVVHVHETQPMLAVMTAQAVTLWGMARSLKPGLRGALVAGLGVGLACLANGLSAVLMTAPLLLLLPTLTARLTAALTAVGVAALWLVPMAMQAPDALGQWWAQSLSASTPHLAKFSDTAELLGLLGWFVWPMWPIAGWALWRERRHLGSRAWQIVSLAIALALLVTSLTGGLRPAGFLPLLLPMAMAAAAGVTTLRRGAANAFDWFGGMTFAAFALLLWTAWSAMVFDWPPGLSRHLAKVTPNFSLESVAWPSILGILLCLGWATLVANTRRSPYRGAQNSAAGMTMLWCLAVILLQPWFDYSKSHTPAVSALRTALAAHPAECVSGLGLSPSLSVSLDYLAGIRPHAVADKRCPLILIVGTEVRDMGEPVWRFERGGGNRREVLSLYARTD
ncbi:hypothetical protein [Denitromonas sp.]|uniref:ArnT family glycosyltransferase n=1 Tax=Denitromonas sp. TaxID=2734609 RepID=UPI002AFFCBAB|nr:hypothetical protein [Denitromonas sp.]